MTTKRQANGYERVMARHSRCITHHTPLRRYPSE